MCAWHSQIPAWHLTTNLSTGDTCQGAQTSEQTCAEQLLHISAHDLFLRVKWHLKVWFLELNRAPLVSLCLHNISYIGSGCCALHSDTAMQNYKRQRRHRAEICPCLPDKTSKSILPIYFSWVPLSQCSWGRWEYSKLSTKLSANTCSKFPQAVMPRELFPFTSIVEHCTLWFGTSAKILLCYNLLS